MSRRTVAQIKRGGYYEGYQAGMDDIASLLLDPMNTLADVREWVINNTRNNAQRRELEALDREAQQLRDNPDPE